MLKQASDALRVKRNPKKKVRSRGRENAPQKQRVRNKSNNSQSVYASSISCPSAPNYRKMTRVPSLNRIHKSGNYAEGRSRVVVAANRNGDSSAPASQKEKRAVEKEYA